MAFYNATLLASKTPVSETTAASLDEFVQVFVSADDLKPLAAQMDKMCLRSPEAVLPSMCHFYGSFSDIAALSQLFSASLDNTLQTLSKSTNPAVRGGACRLFDILVRRADAQASEKVIKSLAESLKSGKSISADQRAARATMLSSVQPGPFSDAIVQAVIALLPKETNEAALQSLMATFALHAPSLLNAATADTAKVLVKGMSEAKAPLRKSVCAGVGQALWSSQVTAEPFQDALLPALDNNFKNATTNPLTNPAGPLEGYIATALLERSLTSQKAKDFAQSNAIAVSLLQTGVKPSFLLWDKMVRKAEAELEQIWLCRALLSTLVSRKDTLIEQTDLPLCVDHSTSSFPT